MRDPKRINQILEELKAFWTKHPDLRLTQLVQYIAYEAGGSKYIDTFYVEDDKILKQLEKENNDESASLGE